MVSFLKPLSCFFKVPLTQEPKCKADEHGAASVEVGRGQQPGPPHLLLPIHGSRPPIPPGLDISGVWENAPNVIQPLLEQFQGTGNSLSLHASHSFCGQFRLLVPVHTQNLAQDLPLGSTENRFNLFSMH